MKLLNDKEIDELIQKNKLIQNWSYRGDVDDEHSPIQPASFDFQVGEIFVPGAKAGSEASGRGRYNVPPGGTAVIVTQETVAMDSDMAGIVFPASSVAFRGIIITNPGHIDPGYAGHLKFTLVNIGKEPYEIRAGDPLVTALFIQIDPCRKHWMQRRGKSVTPPGPGDAKGLSRDFLDVDERAAGKARNAILKWGAGLVAVSGVVIAGINQFGTTRSTDWREALITVKEDVSRLKQTDYQSLTDRLYRVESELRNWTSIFIKVSGAAATNQASTTPAPPTNPNPQVPK